MTNPPRSTNSPAKLFRIEVAAATAFWTTVSLLYTLQSWWLSQQLRERGQPLSAVLWTGTFYLFWIPLTVVVWRLTANWTPSRLGWPRYLIQHLLLAAAAASVHNAIMTLGVVIAFAPPGEPFRGLFFSALRNRSYTELVIYGGAVASGQAIRMYHRWRDRDAQAARLEAQLAVAQLQALDAQIHPHFLFNSLHTIASLAREGRNDDVVRMIADLSGLLRDVTDRSASSRPLREEVEFARKYLDIQRARFDDRLRVLIDIAPEAADVIVPSLTLQPLVDNAIRHGIATSVRGGTIAIHARVDAGHLQLEIEDDGTGPASGWNLESTAGTGLANLRSRLHILYDGRAILTAGPRDAGGFRVAIRVPMS